MPNPAISVTAQRDRAKACAAARRLAPLVLILLSPLLRADDAYLDAIRTEADKLDAASVVAPARAAAEPAAGFEQELQARYRGTYLFYKKLPPKSQEEVLLEYQQGASIEDVRKTIMNRFLHSR
jgi:hypothetical protein